MGQFVSRPESGHNRQTDSVDSQLNMQKKGKVREYTPEGKEKGKPKL